MPVKSIDKTPKKVYVSKKAQTKHQRKSMLVKSIDKEQKKNPVTNFKVENLEKY